MPPSKEGLARWKLKEKLRKREMGRANKEKATDRPSHSQFRSNY
jgi:hypothetical protein